MLEIPAHRYIRVRALQEVPQGQLTQEVLRLRLLPPLGAAGLNTEMAEFYKNLPKRDTTDKKAKRVTAAAKGSTTISLVVDNTTPTPPAKKKRGRPKKEKPLRHSFLDPRPDNTLTVAQYAAKYGLTSFLTESGQERILNALDLWVDSTARELVCGMLSASADSRMIVHMLSNTDQAKTSFKHIRPTDIDAFESLFWDFSGMTIRQKLNWLRSSEITLYSYTAATEGLQSMLWTMGLNTLNLSRTYMLKTAQNALFSRIHQERFNPGSVPAGDLQKLVSSLMLTFDAQEKYDNTADQDIQSQLMASSVETSEAEFPPALEELIGENDAQQVIEHLAYALRQGQLEQGEFDTLRQRVLEGDNIEAKLSPLLLRRTAAVTSLGLDQKTAVDDDDEQTPYDSFVFDRGKP